MPLLNSGKFTKKKQLKMLKKKKHQAAGIHRTTIMTPAAIQQCTCSVFTKHPKNFVI